MDKKVGIVLLGYLVVGIAKAAINPMDETVLHPAIPLLDETGQHVLNTGLPYSTKMSCGNGQGSGCHDYEKISSAYHFEQGRDESSDTFGIKRGLSSLVSPGYFGGYTCMQGHMPGSLAKKENTQEKDFADWGTPAFVKECSSCHAGGGWEEKDRYGVPYLQGHPQNNKDGDYFYRDEQGQIVQWDWKKSGVREVDCLLCHADFSLLKKFSPALLANTDTTREATDENTTAFKQWGVLQDKKFIQGGFFRYANSAVLAFLNIRPDLPEGMNLLTVARLSIPSTSTSPSDYSLSLTEQGTPQLHWNRSAFNTYGKVSIPLRRFPDSDNCMVCHLTGEGTSRITPDIPGSRRGFYGFGEGARQQHDTQGLLVPDSHDDVHKGVTWLDDSGESRVIDNCNACHTKQYYKPLYANIDLDADHHFPKGDGDADVRNDLDKHPGPFSCEYCHDTAKHPALPSGHKNILDAHRELWKFRGDMAGYAENTLNKVTQVHLDQVACQSCHINKITYQGKPILFRFRYRLSENGRMKVYPYTPSSRFYAKDTRYNRILYRYEWESVFVKKVDAEGKYYGAIVDPTTGRETGRVPFTEYGEWGTPATYEGWKAWKLAYDHLLEKKGYSHPDVHFVFIESNEYLVTHQTRPASEAVVCTECHVRKQNGSINALLSVNGLFGEGNTAEVAKLPDRRLVEEGIVELGMPYYKVTENGQITENVADVLYATKIDPSLSILRSQTTRIVTGQWQYVDAGVATHFIGLPSQVGSDLMRTMNSGEWLVFRSKIGHESLRECALIAPGNSDYRGSLEGTKLEVESREPALKERQRIKKSSGGMVVSDIYSLHLLDTMNRPIEIFPHSGVLVKLPYIGHADNLKKIQAVYSENGQRWQRITQKDMVTFYPPSEETGGFVIVRVAKPFSYLALTDKRN